MEKGNGNGEAEGEKAETRGPSPDIENTSTSFGRRDVVSRSDGISFALVERRQVAAVK